MSATKFHTHMKQQANFFKIPTDIILSSKLSYSESYISSHVLHIDV